MLAKIILDHVNSLEKKEQLKAIEAISEEIIKSEGEILNSVYIEVRNKLLKDGYCPDCGSELNSYSRGFGEMQEHTLICNDCGWEDN